MKKLSTKQKLPHVLQDFIDRNKWEDEIEIDDDSRSSRVSTRMTIKNQEYRLFIETDDEKAYIKVFMYTPFNIPEKKITDAKLLVNEINNWLDVGRLSVVEADGPFQYKGVVDVENSEPHHALITNILAAASGTFTVWGEALGAVALTKKTAAEVLDEMKEESRNAEQSVPDKL